MADERAVTNEMTRAVKVDKPVRPERLSNHNYQVMSLSPSRFKQDIEFQTDLNDSFKITNLNITNEIRLAKTEVPATFRIKCVSP